MPKLFLDSGAYSAYTNKTQVNINDYMEFIKEHEDEIEVYANLDDIGSAEKTWENQRIMESEGFHPIPVYHLSDAEDPYLRMAMEYDYFAVGGLASAKGRALKPFIANIFRQVCIEKNDYYPTHKVHGFGIATPEIITMFPWYSIDSTSWVMYGRYGIILTPSIKYGEITYKDPPYAVPISYRSKAMGQERKHLVNYKKTDLAWVKKYIQEKGFDIGETEIKVVDSKYKLKDNENWVKETAETEDGFISYGGPRKVEVTISPGLSNNGELRDRFNLLYFLELEKFIPKYPWRWVPPSVALNEFSFKSDVL
ncbi:MAG: hypothetical protein WC346_18550 [Methanogenium sp.]